jgi:hypothetical protein
MAEENNQQFIRSDPDPGGGGDPTSPVMGLPTPVVYGPCGAKGVQFGTSGALPFQATSAAEYARLELMNILDATSIYQVGVIRYHSLGVATHTDVWNYGLLLDGKTPKLGDVFYGVGQEWMDYLGDGAGGIGGSIQGNVGSQYGRPYHYFGKFKVLGLLDPIEGPIFSEDAMITQNDVHETLPGGQGANASPGAWPILQWLAFGNYHSSNSILSGGVPNLLGNISWVPSNSQGQNVYSVEHFPFIDMFSHSFGAHTFNGVKLLGRGASPCKTHVLPSKKVVHGTESPFFEWGWNNGILPTSPADVSAYISQYPFGGLGTVLPGQTINAWPSSGTPYGTVLPDYIVGNNNFPLPAGFGSVTGGIFPECIIAPPGGVFSP